MKKVDIKKLLGLNKRVKMFRFSEFPPVLQMRILKEIGLAMLVLVIGGILLFSTRGAQSDRIALIAVTVLIAAITAYMAYSSYMAVATGNYEIYEGTCIENTLAGKTVVKLWSAVKKSRNVYFESEDGTSYSISCRENKRIAQVGYPIRVYAPADAKPILKDGTFIIYQYLAIESQGKKKQPAENQ